MSPAPCASNVFQSILIIFKELIFNNVFDTINIIVEPVLGVPESRLSDGNDSNRRKTIAQELFALLSLQRNIEFGKVCGS